MKLELLQSFVALDGSAFAGLMRHLGFASAACYRCGEKGLLQILSTETAESSAWPAAVSPRQEPLHYTTAEGVDAKLGWARAEALQGPRKTWPKGAYLYFPEQALSPVKLVFAVQNPVGKRCRTGELSAPLEALATRLRGIIGEARIRHELSEAGLKEHLRTLGLDLAMMIDHELRTPLASVAGYAALLKDTRPDASPDAWDDYWRVVETQTASALDAVEKLSFALQAGSHRRDPVEAEAFDANEELRLLTEQALEYAPQLVGDDVAKRLGVRYLRATDRALVVRANRRLFRWAMWEVLKNAVSHTRAGKVEVKAFAGGGMLVVDVEDDGAGVPLGAEELVFLRFYQDPSATSQKRARRGLGLGLFLARQIVERHLGQLAYVRAKGRGSVFRFMWPLAEEAADPQNDETLQKGA